MDKMMIHFRRVIAFMILLLATYLFYLAGRAYSTLGVYYFLGLAMLNANNAWTIYLSILKIERNNAKSGVYL